MTTRSPVVAFTLGLGIVLSLGGLQQRRQGRPTGDGDTAIDRRGRRRTDRRADRGHDGNRRRRHGAVDRDRQHRRARDGRLRLRRGKPRRRRRRRVGSTAEMAILRFSFGTMGSGKSTLALQIHHNLSNRQLFGLLLTSLDREGAQVTSRLGVAAPADRRDARPRSVRPRSSPLAVALPGVRRGAVLHRRAV